MRTYAWSARRPAGSVNSRSSPHQATTIACCSLIRRRPSFSWRAGSDHPAGARSPAAQLAERRRVLSVRRRELTVDGYLTMGAGAGLPAVTGTARLQEGPLRILEPGAELPGRGDLFLLQERVRVGVVRLHTRWLNGQIADFHGHPGVRGEDVLDVGDGRLGVRRRGCGCHHCKGDCGCRADLGLHVAHGYRRTPLP